MHHKEGSLCKRGGGGGGGGGGAGEPRRLGLRSKPRGGFAARMLLGAPRPRWGFPPPNPLLNGVWGVG